MFFDKHLKQKISTLQKKILRFQQVKDSLDTDMLVLTLNESGTVTWQNANSAKELG